MAFVCPEIGGANSVEPLTVGAELQIPVVDADGMGRAFPELQMFLPFVYGCPPYPADVGNERGEVAAVAYADTAKQLEDFLRPKTVEMGFVFLVKIESFIPKIILIDISKDNCSHASNFVSFFLISLTSCMAGLAFVLDWKDVKGKCALYTLSRSWRLGNAVRRARLNKASPVDSIFQHENGF